MPCNPLACFEAGKTRRVLGYCNTRTSGTRVTDISTRQCSNMLLCWHEYSYSNHMMSMLKSSIPKGISPDKYGVECLSLVWYFVFGKSRNRTYNLRYLSPGKRTYPFGHIPIPPKNGSMAMDTCECHDQHGCIIFFMQYICTESADNPESGT